MNGPYESERQTLEVPAVRATYAAMGASSRRGVMAEHGHRMLCEAAGASGINLGAYDHKIIQWLAGFGPQECAVFAGLITRAHRAGLAAGQEGR